MPIGTQRFLAAFEGIEGGFAVGASIVLALAISGMERNILLTTALVSIIVSGFNSASVKYSSEHYLDQLDGREKRSAFRHYFIPSLIEFFFYILLSLFTVFPLIVIHDVFIAVGLTIGITLVLLFIAGLWRSYMVRMNGLRDGLETVILGFGIIAVGLVSGLIVNSL